MVWKPVPSHFRIGIKYLALAVTTAWIITYSITRVPLITKELKNKRDAPTYRPQLSFTYSKYYNMEPNISIHNGVYRFINHSSKVEPNEIKNILYWDTFYGDKNMSLGLGKDIFQNCPINNCFTTYNRDYLPVEDFDAIIFHGARWSSNKYPVPNRRKRKQKYIFFSLESPKHTYFDKSYIENFYNWTMTYRRDSDIHLPYSLIEYNPNNYSLPKKEDILERPGKIAWLVSNCSPQTRKDYAENLKNYIPIDIFGKCGTKNCSRDNSCYEMIENKYKFYLSFENTLCEDYVTEKLFHMLSYNIIPVVFGNADYNEIAPPNSFIDTKKFKSPKELADYLLYLDNNVEEYLKFFEWKTSYRVIKPTNYALCQLCELLHKTPKISTYINIAAWYSCDSR